VSREEVAVLAAMSVTWYTWLEQARPMNPSRQVMDALARVLALTPAEHAYVLELTGYLPGPAPEPAPPADAPAHLQRLLDGMASFPAFAVAPDWRIAGWNRAYQCLYPGIATAPAATRNLLWLVFTDPYVREMLPDWAADSRHFVAEFRAEAGARLTDATYVELVQALLATSADFAAVWPDHEVQRFATRTRRFHHRQVGDLVFEHHRLVPSDSPGFHIVVYTPAPGHDTEARLETLLHEPRPGPSVSTQLSETGAMALADVHRLTVDQFLAIPGLPERTELIEGLIYDVTPEGPRQAAPQGEVAQALIQALPGWRVLMGGSLRVTTDFCPIPDIAVYPLDVDLSADTFNAEDVGLVVEVGVSSRRTDRELKMPAYASGGVPELWLVAPEAGSLTLYGDPEDGWYETLVPLSWPEGLVTALERLVTRLA
jgi:Uma2 family endonuclease/transcriptional regulator with XRE-family HTH domain